MVVYIAKKHKIGKILILFRQNPYTYIIFRINFVVEKVSSLVCRGLVVVELKTKLL